MILSFSRQFPWKEPTNFIQKIQKGTKIHTFRIGHRWNVGDKIHFWDQNPRSTMMKPKPKPFNLPLERSETWYDLKSGKECEFDESETFGFIPTQKNFVPVVSHIENWKMIMIHDHHCVWKFHLQIGDQNVYMYGCFEKEAQFYYKYIEPDFLLEDVAINDGFDQPIDFIKYFSWEMIQKPIIKSKAMDGQIIHWTNNTYTL